MIPGRGLVLDANILIRAVLGKRVRALLETYEDSAAIYSPDVCFDEAHENIPLILSNRGNDPKTGIVLLDQLRLFVQPVDEALYQNFEHVARGRVAMRDIEDWPVVAVALMLNVPIWTEDLFGGGIATWTTDRVELYLKGDHG